MKTNLLALFLLRDSAHSSVLTIDVTADIDGRDQLIISGNTLQWQHFDYLPVGLNAGANPYTFITTTLDGVIVLNQAAWIPTWPNGTASGAFSSVFTGLVPAIPQQPTTFSLDVEQARYAITTQQIPTAANSFTAVIEFNDDPPLADATYQAKVTFATVPEPSAAALVGTALLSLALVQNLVQWQRDQLRQTKNVRS